jgi:polyphosphate kinase 2 (PPK2 family)
MLHISRDEQKERLHERLERPDKHWKYRPGDIDERMLWDDYRAAYQLAIERTDADHAPWFVVPANHKWYARLAVQSLLITALERIDPQWPVADFDVEVEKARLAAT